MANPRAAYKRDFFLAHAAADKDDAERLDSYLRPHSRVFLDSRDLLLGDNWDQALREAQESSLITVVLISSRTDRAYYQREEIAAAIALAREDANGHRVIPVFLDEPHDSEVPYGLLLKHGARLSKDFTLKDFATLLLSQLPKIQARHGESDLREAAEGATRLSLDDRGSLGQNPKGPQLCSRVPSNNSLSPSVEQCEKYKWQPDLTLRSVNRRFAGRHVPYLFVALLFGVLGYRVFASEPATRYAFQEAVVCSIVACALAALVLTGPLDHQFVLSIVRGLFFLAIVGNLCGLASAFGANMLIHRFFVGAAVVFGVVKLSFGGLARYYWQRRQVGDLILELLPVALFATGSFLAAMRMIMS